MTQEGEFDLFILNTFDPCMEAAIALYRVHVVGIGHPPHPGRRVYWTCRHQGAIATTQCSGGACSQKLRGAVRE
jgi:hypothetical protein